MMWPLLLDYSRDECKRILRKLELEAYAAVVSAFRAQGDLSKDKKNILQELCSCLSISLERHRAEIRRSVNDEKLNTIADRMAGPNTSTEWAIEGRRLIPLMPRLVPQTAFTAIANNAANIQAAKNAAMPAPSATGVKESDRQNTNGVSSAPPTPTRTVQMMRPPSGPSPVSANSQHPVSPGSNNILVLPSGMSIHIKGGEGNEDETNNRKRKRSSSFDSIANNPQKIMVTPSVVAHSAATTGGNPSAMRVTIAGTLAKSTTTVSGPQGSKQVILLSGSNSNISPSILHRCLSVPVVKTVATTTNNIVSSQTKATVSTTYSTIASPGSNMVGSAAFSGHSGLTATSTSTGGSMVVYASARPRPKTISVPRQVVRPRSSVMVSPNNPTGLGAAAPQFPSPRTQAPGIRPFVRTPVQYRQQDIGGGVKIITQSIPTSASRLLPKPSNNSLIVVTSASSVAQRQCTTIAGSGSQSTPRIVNVMSVAPSQARMASRSQPIAGQAAATGKISPSPRHGPPSKPNVIVVHKAQTWPSPQNQGTAYVVSTPTQFPRSAEAVTYVQRQEKSKQGGMVTVVKTVAPPRTGNVAITNSSVAVSSVSTSAASTAVFSDSAPVSTSQNEVTLAELQAAEHHKNSLLADLIQAAGIVPESKASATTVVLKTAQSVVSTPRVPTPPITTEVVSLEETMVVEEDIAGSPDLLQLTEILAQSQSEGKDSAQELSLDAESEVSIQEIDLPLDQLQEGQVLEIQANDASVLLNQSGQLSKEVLDLLQQAGIQIQQDVQVTTSMEPLKGSDAQPSKSNEDSQEQQGSMTFLQEKVGEDTLVASTDNLPSIVEVFSTAFPTDFQTVHIAEDVITSREANNGPVVETTMEMSKTSATTPVQQCTKVPDVSGDPYHQQHSEETPKENYLASNVLVEPSELDTTGMKLEDFASQKVESCEFAGDTIEFNL